MAISPTMMPKPVFFFLVFCLICPVQNQAQGRLERLTLPFGSSDRTVHIYLPANYHQKKKRYPVLYLNDAQNLFSDQTAFAGEWRVDETLDSLKAAVIVVGIEHGNEKRIDELTPFPNQKYGGGKADDYLKFLIESVKPEVDKRYRTKRGAAHTGIGGSALGGLLALYAVETHPDIFSKALVFSPSLWFGPDIFRYTESKKLIHGRIYVMAGDAESADMIPDLLRMEKLLVARMRPGHLKKHVVPGGGHNEKTWRDGFANAYLWLFKGTRFF